MKKIKIDPKLAAMWKREIAIVRRDVKTEAEAWGEEWRAVGRILEPHPPLYELGGFKSADDFAKRELKTDATTMHAEVRVAQHASAADVVKHGVFKLAAAIGYIEASAGPLPVHAPVHFDRVRVEGKSLDDCSVAFVKAARRRARAGKKKAAPTRYRDALETAFATHVALAHVAVHESGGKTSFHGVPNASLRTFADVIRAARLPVER